MINLPICPIKTVGWSLPKKNIVDTFQTIRKISSGGRGAVCFVSLLPEHKAGESNLMS